MLHVVGKKPLLLNSVSRFNIYPFRFWSMRNIPSDSACGTYKTIKKIGLNRLKYKAIFFLKIFTINK